MKENKISIEITADGWKTDVTIELAEPLPALRTPDMRGDNAQRSSGA